MTLHFLLHFKPCSFAFANVIFFWKCLDEEKIFVESSSANSSSRVPKTTVERRSEWWMIMKILIDLIFECASFLPFQKCVWEVCERSSDNRVRRLFLGRLSQPRRHPERAHPGPQNSRKGLHVSRGPPGMDGGQKRGQGEREKTGNANDQVGEARFLRVGTFYCRQNTLSLFLFRYQLCLYIASWLCMCICAPLHFWLTLLVIFLNI